MPSLCGRVWITPESPRLLPLASREWGGRDFDLPRHSHYSGVIPMVFQHSGGRDFDLPRHSHYSGVNPIVEYGVST